MKKDKSQALLDSLPELTDGEKFLFDCNASVPCFNHCCSELTLPLTPYDVMRLCEHLGTNTDNFLKKYTQMRTFPDVGFPLPLLKMQDGPKEICPFVTPAGCAVYANRPCACRTYPLGRGTRMTEDGDIIERFFIVQEKHCHGFEMGEMRTAHEWLKDQGLEPYNESNDKYTRLMGLVKKTNAPVSPKMATMIVLCLYQLDRFREFLAQMNIFSKLVIDTEYCERIMADNEVCLNFAYDWIELVIFGESPNLKRIL